MTRSTWPDTSHAEDSPLCFQLPREGRIWAPLRPPGRKPQAPWGEPCLPCGPGAPPLARGCVPLDALQGKGEGGGAGAPSSPGASSSLSVAVLRPPPPAAQTEVPPPHAHTCHGASWPPAPPPPAIPNPPLAPDPLPRQAARPRLRPPRPPRSHVAKDAPVTFPQGHSAPPFPLHAGIPPTPGAARPGRDRGRSLLPPCPKGRRREGPGGRAALRSRCPARREAGKVTGAVPSLAARGGPQADIGSLPHIARGGRGGSLDSP